MGKKSLIKSTSKKKTAAKKTGPAKKKAAAKKTAAKKTAKKKAAAKKAAPKKTVAKTVAAKKAAPKKAPAKKRTVKELLNQKFEWPQTGKVVKATRAAVKFKEPPPFIASKDKKEVAAIKAVMQRTFDMAAIKEAGDKATAEKAAQAKAAAEKVKVSYTAPAATATPPTPPADRTGQYLSFGAAGIAILLFLLVIGASMNNSDTYYIKPAAGAIEIWQGKFAPIGKKLLVTLPGVPAPEETQPQYDKKAVFPLIYSYYISKADALLAAPGFPDFEEIKKYLEKTLKYAHTSDLRKSVYARIDGIDIAIYMYKADVAASRGTTADLEIALAHLASAATLNPDENLLELIEQKKLLFSDAIAANRAQAEAEALAAEEALATQQAAVDAEAEPAAPPEPGPAEGQPAADH